jgi:uncharacterized protein (TIGR00730 family)
MRELKAVCVFCGSNYGVVPEYEAGARAFGRLLAETGRTLVYGGGKVGLMGAVADAALEAGGKVIGVIPTFLKDKELAHPGLTELVVVGSMHERKAKMEQLSDAFACLPGGLGTYEEMFEVLSWAQLGMHEKPVGVLNTSDFYQPLLTMLDSTAAAGFMHEKNRSVLVAGDDAAALLAALENYRPIHASKWLERSGT